MTCIFGITKFQIKIAISRIIIIIIFNSYLFKVGRLRMGVFYWLNQAFKDESRNTAAGGGQTQYDTIISAVRRYRETLGSIPRTPERTSFFHTSSTVIHKRDDIKNALARAYRKGGTSSDPSKLYVSFLFVQYHDGGGDDEGGPISVQGSNSIGAKSKYNIVGEERPSDRGDAAYYIPFMINSMTNTERITGKVMRCVDNFVETIQPMSTTSGWTFLGIHQMVIQLATALGGVSEPSSARPAVPRIMDNVTWNFAPVTGERTTPTGLTPEQLNELNINFAELAEEGLPIEDAFQDMPDIVDIVRPIDRERRDVGRRIAPLRRLRRSERLIEQQFIPRSARTRRPAERFVPPSSNGRIRPGRGFRAGADVNSFKTYFPLTPIKRLYGIIEMGRTECQICVFDAVGLHFDRAKFIEDNDIFINGEGPQPHPKVMPYKPKKTTSYELFRRFYDCTNMEAAKEEVRVYEGFDLHDEIADLAVMVGCQIFVYEFLEDDLVEGSFSGRLDLLFHTRDFATPLISDGFETLSNDEVDHLFDFGLNSTNVSKDKRKYSDTPAKRLCLREYASDCTDQKFDIASSIHLLYHNEHICLITDPRNLCDSVWCPKCSQIPSDRMTNPSDCVRKLMTHMGSRNCKHDIGRRFFNSPQVYSKPTSLIRELMGLPNLEGKLALNTNHRTNFDFLLKGFATLDFEVVALMMDDFGDQKDDVGKVKKTQVKARHDPCISSIAHNLDGYGYVDIINEKEKDEDSNQPFIDEVMSQLTKLAARNLELNEADPCLQRILSDPNVSEEDKKLLRKKMSILPVITVNGGRYDMKLIEDELLRYAAAKAELFKDVEFVKDIDIRNKYRMKYHQVLKRKHQQEEELAKEMMLEKELDDEEENPDVIVLNRDKANTKFERVFKPVQKGSNYIEMRFPTMHFTIRDILYIFPKRLDLILETFNPDGIRKGYYPYEKTTSLAFLRKVHGEPGCEFPYSKEDFWSELTNSNPLRPQEKEMSNIADIADEKKRCDDVMDVNYKEVQRVWKNEADGGGGMTTMFDYFVWYGRRDVVPLVKALEVMRHLFAKDGIDIFHDVLTMPGYGERSMAYGIQEFADLDSIPELNYYKDKIDNQNWGDIDYEKLAINELPNAEMNFFSKGSNIEQATETIINIVNPRFTKIALNINEVNNKFTETPPEVEPATTKRRKSKKGPIGVRETNMKIKEVWDDEMKMLLALSYSTDIEILRKSVEEDGPITVFQIIARYMNQDNRCAVCLGKFSLASIDTDDKNVNQRLLLKALCIPIDKVTGFKAGNIAITCFECAYSIYTKYLRRMNDIKIARRMYTWTPEKIIMMVPNAEIFDMLKTPGGPTFVMHRQINIDGWEDGTVTNQTLTHSPNGVPFFAFRGLDANALYPYALQKDLPCGLLRLEYLSTCYLNDGPELQELARKISCDEIYGMVEVDIYLPKHLWEQFPYLQPLFVTTKIPERRDIIGDYTYDQIGEKKVKLEGNIKTLCCVYRARKLVLNTGMIKDLLGYGLKLRAAHRIIHATPAKCVRQFIRTTSNQRRFGDLAKKNGPIAEVAKLKANGCFGRTMLDKTKHEDKVYEVEKKDIKRLISQRTFLSGEVIKTDNGKHDIYIIKRSPSSVKMDMPAQLAFTVFMESKRLMLAFVYKFLQPCLGLGNYRLLYMDTDCEIVAFTGKTIEDSVLPEQRDNFNRLKRDFLVPRVCDAIVDVDNYIKKYLKCPMDYEFNYEFPDDLMTRSLFEYFGHDGKFSIYREAVYLMTDEELTRKNVMKKLGISFLNYMSREPGLFKLEFEGTKGTFLSAKSYHMSNFRTGNKKAVMKNGVAVLDDKGKPVTKLDKDNIIVGYKIGSVKMFDDNDNPSPEVFKASLLNVDHKYEKEYQRTTKGGSKGISKKANSHMLNADNHERALKGEQFEGINNRFGVTNHQMEFTFMKKKLFNNIYKKKVLHSDGITCGPMILDPDDDIYWEGN